MKRLLTVALLAFLVPALAVAQDEQIEQVEIGYVLWDSEIASTHVLAAVIRDELGYDVNLIPVDAGVMYQGLVGGDLDVSVSVALPFTHAHYWEEYSADLLDLGSNMDGTTIGLTVPSYVEIDSIEEMNEHTDMFGGEIIGIEPGAGIMTATENTIEAYGLDNLELVDGSDAAMVAALDRAIARDEWIVITGWEPHWKWVTYDLKYLEDPKGTYGESGSSHTVLNPGFAETAPQDLMAFLDAFYWTPADMGAVMLSISEDGMDPWEAAEKWVAENQETVQSWLD